VTDGVAPFAPRVLLLTRKEEDFAGAGEFMSPEAARLTRGEVAVAGCGRRREGRANARPPADSRASTRNARLPQTVEKI
jgi:hypothetical protein